MSNGDSLKTKPERNAVTQASVSSVQQQWRRGEVEQGLHTIEQGGFHNKLIIVLTDMKRMER